MTLLRWPLAAIFLVVFPFAKATTVEQVQQTLASHPLVRAHFEQQRTIKGMPQTLNSSGEMVISRTSGLLWQQTTPFAMRLVLQQDRMLQQMQDQPPQVMTAQSNPQMFQFNHLLTALFTADRATLDNNFSLTFTPLEKDHWTLSLTPTTTPLDKLFSTITLQGGQFIDQVTLLDKQGDATRLVFSQQRSTPTELTATEQANFESH
ncbi:LolA family protein [Rosenbergiella collisarenosi]|uniref:LolA family protein n=1 Tax=Rosenbergiella collisarenosi TaxID=1544695 RepID=UPI001BDB29F6|nr:outer membrane lipoprotein carrier protein LolA [Rosenbergiella collisarenosi]MBT0719693.1 outer membrane lipoprotein carrier protein LolA [Rosenbergiella collisarenosi]